MTTALVGLLVVSNLLWWWRCASQAREILTWTRLAGDYVRESQVIKRLLTEQHAMIIRLLSMMPPGRGH